MFFRAIRRSVILFLAGALTVIVAAVVVFGGVAPPHFARRFDLSAYAEPVLDLRRADYAELAGWQSDDPVAAFAAFLASCRKTLARAPEVPANPHENLGSGFEAESPSGAVADWEAPCRAAADVKTGSFTGAAALRAALRTFFEVHFQPFEVRERRDPLQRGPARRAPPRFEAEGLFTGYYEPVFEAARAPGGEFSAPVYSRPGDLVDVDLGLFRDQWAGERVAGRLIGASLVPYPDRLAIEDGALDGVAAPVAWMRPNDLFFLQIQGSGRLTFADGGAIRVGYAGQNGHPYQAIGRVLVERGLMPLDAISMQSIRAWLADAGPDAAKELRAQNPSYVFFDAKTAGEDGQGPVGAQGVPLTPGRSLAVDRRVHALGAPIWIDIEPVEAVGPDPIRKLMIAQDAGGAIRGPIRGDVFWGTGAEAGEIAGAMRAKGRLFVLIPRDVAARLP